MTRKSTKDGPQGLCAMWHADDGVRPDELRRQDRREQGGNEDADHKQQRLCRQVRKALQLALADCGDPVLQQVEVMDVALGTQGTELVVTVTQAITAPPGLTPVILQDRLTAARGVLRTATAASISRKRTPQLVFRTLARREDQP